MHWGAKRYQRVAPDGVKIVRDLDPNNKGLIGIRKRRLKIGLYALGVLGGSPPAVFGLACGEKDS